MEGRRHVTQHADERRVRRASEIERVVQLTGPHRRDRSIAPDPKPPDRLGDRAQGAAGGAAPGREAQPQRAAARMPRGEVGDEAVARYDVEPDARHDHDARPGGLRTARGQRLEHVDLAGDVEIVRARPEAGVVHGEGGAREGSRAVKNHGYVLEGGDESGRIVQPDGPGLQPGRGGGR